MASRNDLAIDADAVDAVDADNAVESYAAVDACNAIDDNAVANGLIIPMANRLSLSRRSLQCGMPLSGLMKTSVLLSTSLTSNEWCEDWRTELTRALNRRPGFQARVH